MSVGGYQSAGLRRRQLARKVRWYIGLVIFAVVVITACFIIGYSGLFEVKKFALTGAPLDERDRILGVLRPQVIAGRLGGILGTDNFFSWSDSLTYEDVRSNRVSVKKKLLSREVEIIVHPREAYGVWCVDGAGTQPASCYWVDPTGVAFEPAPILEGQLITAVFDTASTTSVVLGSAVIKGDYFEVVKRIGENIVKLNLPVRRIVVDRVLEEVQLYTYVGPKISFSLRFDPTLSALPALKKLIESPGLTNMRSVDFTVENRVFYTVK